MVKQFVVSISVCFLFLIGPQEVYAFSGRCSAAVQGRYFTTKDPRVGIWKVPDSENGIIVGDTFYHPVADIFSFDGKYITMRWFTISWSPYSADGFFKLETKWNGDTLFYRSPYAVWEPGMMYRNEVYISVKGYPDGNGKEQQWIYQRVNPGQVTESDTAILEKREAYTYPE